MEKFRNTPIEVIVFTDEEGFRFGKGLLGSSSLCGQDPDVSDDELDIYGEPRGEVMKHMESQVQM